MTSYSDSDYDDDVYFDYVQKPKTVRSDPATEIRYRSWRLTLPIRTNNKIDDAFEDGNSILLPSRLLETLSTTPEHSALTFSVKSPITDRECFCGVDFHSHDNNVAIAPGWMFSKQLLCDIGTVVDIQQVLLPKASYIKIKLNRHNEKIIFDENKNIKTLLEKALERFIVVFVGLTLRTPNPSNSSQMLEFEIVELKPTPAVILTNADPEVEFQFSNNNNNNNFIDNIDINNKIDFDDDDDDDEITFTDKPIANNNKIVPTPITPSSTISSRCCSSSSSNSRSVSPMSTQGHTLGSACCDSEKESAGVDSKVCDNCSKRIPVAQFRIHSLRCRIAKTKCPECGDVVDKSEIEGHNKMYHTVVKCPRCGRGCKGTSQLESHECPLDRVLCMYCGLEVVRRELGDHLQMCGSRTSKCEKCGKNVKNADMEEHVKNNCMMVCPLCMRPFDKVAELQRHAAACEGFYDGCDGDGCDECDDVVIVDEIPEVFKNKNKNKK